MELDDDKQALEPDAMRVSELGCARSDEARPKVASDEILSGEPLDEPVTAVNPVERGRGVRAGVDFQDGLAPRVRANRSSRTLRREV